MVERDRGREIEVFDTTLRDGEQTPGLGFTLEEKIEIAQALDGMGVSVIEAGFPKSSADELRAVEEITAAVGTSTASLARIKRGDVEEAFKAGTEIVHLFASTSEVQMEKSMKMTPEEVLEDSVEMVQLVKDEDKFCLFSPMDATRTETDYLIEICKAVEEAGADMINVPDTVGIGRPEEVEKLVGSIKSEVEIPLSIHCHNDFGLAVANTLAAVRGGASQVQVTVNGIGERAGNAALEETVMGLECLEGFSTPIDKKQIFKVSKLVERISESVIPPNKPVVGENVFSHESGIHAAGVIAEESTFEPGLMTPEMVGHKRRFVIGKHAGRQGLKKVLQEAGLRPDEEELKSILSKAKSINNKGKQITEADLYAIAETIMENPSSGEGLVKLDQAFVMTGNKATPTGTIKAEVRGNTKTEAATGVGPVDAIFKAVMRLIGGEKRIEISEFRMDAITGGSDAMANVRVSIEDELGNSAQASGTGEDIVIASVEALLNAINCLSLKENAAKKDSETVKG